MTEKDQSQPEAPFVHPSEAQFARLLDFYQIPWEYEPRTFILKQDKDGRVKEAFSPDFYLPEQDLYIELTTMKQSLITKKHGKLRRLRKRYPQINIKLLNRSDFQQMVHKYNLDAADVFASPPADGKSVGTRGNS